MDAGKQNSSYKLTSIDAPFSPSLNSLPSLDNHSKTEPLQINSGEIVHNEQTPVNAHISKSDSSVASPGDIMDHNTRQNQSEKTCTHVILQKKEKEMKSNSVYASEVSKCMCRTEKFPNYYTVDVKSQPTTIVITRRGSKNSIIIEGNGPRFRAGGSTEENPYDENETSREAQGSKGPETVWDRKQTASEQPVSTTSGESLSEKSGNSSSRSESRKRTTFQRMTRRKSSERESKRKSSKSRRSSSPRSTVRGSKSRSRSRISTSLVAKEPRYLGAGPKSTNEDDANKSGESSKSKSFISRHFSRRSKRKSKPSRATSSRSSIRPTRADSEPMYVSDTDAPVVKTPAATVTKDEGVQTDYPYILNSAIEHFLDQHLRACDSCGTPTIHLIGKDGDIKGWQGPQERQVPEEPPTEEQRPVEHEQESQEVILKVCGPACSSYQYVDAPVGSSMAEHPRSSQEESFPSDAERPTSDFKGTSAQRWSNSQPGSGMAHEERQSSFGSQHRSSNQQPSHYSEVNSTERPMSSAPQRWSNQTGSGMAPVEYRSSSGSQYKSNIQQPPASQRWSNSQPGSGMAPAERRSSPGSQYNRSIQQPYADQRWSSSQPGSGMAPAERRSSPGSQYKSNIQQPSAPQRWSNSEMPPAERRSSSGSQYNRSIQQPYADQRWSSRQSGSEMASGSRMTTCHSTCGSRYKSSVQQPSHFSQTSNTARPKSSIRDTSYASNQPGSKMIPENHRSTQSTSQKSPMRYSDTVTRESRQSTVHCTHCGSMLQTEQGDIRPESRASARPSTQSKETSQVLWALAKVKVYKDGTQSFEVLESTSIPPGHYLMPASDDYMMVPSNWLQ